MRRALLVAQAWTLLATLLLVPPAQGQGQELPPPRKIAIEVQGKAEFDVLFRRAMSNATGAVIGGLIGAGIQAGIESNADADMRAALYPHVAEHAWRDVFIKSMTEALAEKDLEPVWIEDGTVAKPGTADFYLVLYPAQYGFRVVDTTSQLMAAFIEFEAAYSSQPVGGKNKPLKEPFYITDKSQVSYQALLDDTAGINPRIESVLKAAARRLTNKIVYNTK